MAPLHLLQHADRAQSRRRLQQRQNLGIPKLGQRVGTTPTTRRTLLRRRPRVGIQSGAGARAEPRLGSGDLAAVGPSKGHVQLRLLIGDVRAGHGRVSSGELRTSPFRHPVTESQAGSLQSRTDAGASLQSGYALPPADPGVIHPNCRSQPS